MKQSKGQMIRIRMQERWLAGAGILLAVLCGGCSTWLPDSGPSYSDVSKQGQNGADIQLVDVDSSVTQRLLSDEELHLFSDVFKDPPAPTDVIGAGDSIDITIWEAPPATLFSSESGSPGGSESAPAPDTAKSTDLPEQIVSSDGTAEIPFIGRIVVQGKTPAQIETEIVDRLKGKAHLPQVLVRLAHNATADVTVVGDVANSIRMPLTPKRERLLDALAAANGSRDPLNKISVQLTRGQTVAVLPLDKVIRDPRQDVELRPGDVITVLFQPFSFTVLGATGKNDEIDFEAKGITLAQALARANGVNDARADAKGVFIFRFEPESSLDWTSPHFITPDGRVPVIYRVDLTDPASFFSIKNFPMKDKDIVYIANAPSVEISKFVELIAPVTAPFINGAAVNTGR
jgi:polysaccharide biosynthesis/export protein